MTVGGKIVSERISSKNMKEVRYYKNVYSKFWVNQTKIYGYGIYEKNLVKLISQSSPKRVFEVGIGTGWPIGAALKKKEIEVDGCDVAERLVSMAQKELRNESGIFVGDVEEYQGDLQYDVTYCVRASWYIPDFYATVKKMAAMTKLGGYIVFDIMDRNSLYCLQSRLRTFKERCGKFLGIHIDERYGTHYISIVEMKKFLKENGMVYKYWRERDITHNKDKANTPKVVFLCRKLC